MNTPAQPTSEVRFTPEFKRNLQALSKKYRHIRNDIEPVIEQLQRGERPGDQIPGIGYTILNFVYAIEMQSVVSVVGIG